MKAEGIYSHLSIYFPLWLKPKPGTPWLHGLRRQQASVRRPVFQPGFPGAIPALVEGLAADARASDRQAAGRRAGRGRPGDHQRGLVLLLDLQPRTTSPTRSSASSRPSSATGSRRSTARSTQALAALEAVRSRPATTRPRAGSVSGRCGTCSTRRSPRDKDTVRFLVESQRRFYRETCQFLREPGLQGADHRLELDHRQPAGLRPAGETTATRPATSSTGTATSAAITRARSPSGRSATATPTPTAARCGSTPRSRASRKAFVHPVMDPHYDGKPSMISETTFCRPEPLPLARPRCSTPPTGPCRTATPSSTSRWTAAAGRSSRASSCSPGR